MRSYFHGHPAPAHPGKLLRHGFLGGGHAALRQLFSVLSQHPIAAGLVSPVHADRDRPSFTSGCPFRTLWDGAILFHGRFPLHFECASLGAYRIPLEAGPLIPSRVERSSHLQWGYNPFAPREFHWRKKRAFMLWRRALASPPRG